MKPTRKHLSTLLGLISIMALLNACLQVAAQVNNSNPNVAKINEYGRIEWHGDTAQLIVAGSRPLHMAALALSSCLGISVSAEEPHYLWLGDLLDVTARNGWPNILIGTCMRRNPERSQCHLKQIMKVCPSISRSFSKKLWSRSTSNNLGISVSSTTFVTTRVSLHLFPPRLTTSRVS